MKKIADTSAHSHNKPIPLPISKQPNPKEKYRLILSIAQLKSPVMSMVQSIMARPEEQQNIIRNTKAKSATKSHAQLKQHNSSVLLETNKPCSHTSSSKQLKKTQGKINFTEKVHRLFASKKYSYCVENDEDNIDRLNAKLDKYISRYLGPERLRNMKNP